MAPSTRPRIRPMTADDIDAATEALLRGDWGDRRDWWRFVVTQEHVHPFVADDGGVIVGTGVGTIHGPVGWVGTIYTVPERRREGIALALSEAVCDRLTAGGCRTLALSATPGGRPVYERLGFAESGWYLVFGREGIEAAADTATGAEAAQDEVTIRHLTGGDLSEVLALDAAVTGEDRASTIRACLATTPGSLVARDADGSLRGSLVRAPWHGAAVIASEPDDAIRLLDARRRAAGPGHAVRAGILEMNAVGRERLEAEGWTELRRIVRMERGEPLDWRPDAIWGQLGFATG